MTLNAVSDIAVTSAPVSTLNSMTWPNTLNFTLQDSAVVCESVLIKAVSRLDSSVPQIRSWIDTVNHIFLCGYICNRWHHNFTRMPRVLSLPHLVHCLDCLKLPGLLAECFSSAGSNLTPCLCCPSSTLSPSCTLFDGHVHALPWWIRFLHTPPNTHAFPSHVHAPPDGHASFYWTIVFACSKVSSGQNWSFSESALSQIRMMRQSQNHLYHQCSVRTSFSKVVQLSDVLVTRLSFQMITFCSLKYDVASDLTILVKLLEDFTVVYTLRGLDIALAENSFCFLTKEK